MDAFIQLEAYADNIIGFTRNNAGWAPYIVFALAFAESVALVSLILPAWGILVGIGALIGASEIEFWPIWLGAAFGAIVGDWVSYLFGFHFKDSATRVWPLSRYPHMLERGHVFFHRWGPWSVFVGRFFGPLRAIVPLLAGIFEMRALHFQLANIASALIWAFVLLVPGTLLMAYFR
ncbi:membrane protein DedA with SNARE-associated domain [Pseudaminobacter salicylatoxidans]|uniref:Membrane protein DedA with SNARE-associated domain n=1 Tax=Pseudaminobacter salicylatoxidans TaxID=93369 RepID=A0A316C7J8_PSESE|nr:DedA family protein [Pseudaminobacter salicylatoxidans]PWJ85691.1 membrane protein DedA with SNARE-associated domain [Pseudaminobacter salicylatoxidans]